MENDRPNVQAAEIERLIDEFKGKFKVRTSDADNFITIHEIERMWGELQQNTLNIYSDMVGDLMGSIDESDLIRKKKRVLTKRNKTANIYETAHFHHYNLWNDVVFTVPPKAADPRKQRKVAGAFRFKKRRSP
ncbi:MAG: hypothetical protein LBK56_14780 [Gracilibacteraceae bacterium]|jgi:hypothetical protein|nr:hypothetical protein [Gracilibacteraceae bacterium]